MSWQLAEPAVALTDLGLAVEAGILAGRIAGRRPCDEALRALFVALFGSMAIGAAAGAVVHGPLPDPRLAAHRAVWRVALGSVAMSAFSLWGIAARLALPAPAAGRLTSLAALQLVGNLVYLARTHAAYRVAITWYLPAAGFLAGALAKRLRDARDRSAAAHGLAAVALSGIAAVAQQKRIGIHPRYFDHNAVYHVIEAISIAELNRSAGLLCDLGTDYAVQ
jgi:hypothetical protein